MSGSAKPVKELPSAEIACPVQNFQKSGLRPLLGALALAASVGMARLLYVKTFVYVVLYHAS